MLREPKLYRRRPIKSNRPTESASSRSIAAEQALGRRIRARGSQHRGVAQLGSASALGAEGRRFKSCHPDQQHHRTSRARPKISTRGAQHVKSTVEKLSPTRVRINVEVPFTELRARLRPGLQGARQAGPAARVPPRQGARASCSRPASAAAPCSQQVVNDALPGRYSEAVTAVRGAARSASPRSRSPSSKTARSWSSPPRSTSGPRSTLPDLRR